MQITLEVSNTLALQLKGQKNKLPQILEYGLRELRASSQAGYSGSAEVLEFLASLPTPEEIIALKPSPELQKQIEKLLEKNRNEGLTEMEEQIWSNYEYLEHLVRMAKAKAFLRLKKAEK